MMYKCSQCYVFLRSSLQYGWSPLKYASGSGHEEVVRALISAGAQVNLLSKVGSRGHQ